MMQKISHIESEYFTISDYNKFMGQILDTKLKDKVDKSAIAGFIDNTDRQLHQNISRIKK